MNTELVQYARDKKGNPIGVVMAIKAPMGSAIRISWSACCRHDEFSKEKGKKIARDRAHTGTAAIIPRKLRPIAEYMYSRAVDYFKTDIVDYAFVMPTE